MISLKQYFNFDQHKTSYKTEIIAGLTTFLAMIYIIVVNANILSSTGMPIKPLVTSTVMISAFACIAMGLYARNPYALAPAMGMNVFFAYTVVGAWGIPWQTALGAVFWSGVIFVLLALFNIRSKILMGIPSAVKHAIGAGIGVFIALVGFHNAGMIQQAPSGLLEITRLSSQTFVFLMCFVVLMLLYVLRVRTAMLVMIIVGCIIAYPFGRYFGVEIILPIPSHFVEAPDFSLFFMIDWVGSLKVAVIPAILTFLFINIFDSTGTLIGLSQSINWLDSKGQPIRMKESLLVDSVASSLSGLIGTSPTSIYVESGTGIAMGGRTGMVAITTGILFLPFLFLAPLVAMVPSFVVAPALVMVGALMMSSVKFIHWNDYKESIPAFLTIILMPLTLSISEGIVWGMVAWFIIAVTVDRKALNPMAVIISFACLLMLLSSLQVL